MKVKVEASMNPTITVTIANESGDSITVRGFDAVRHVAHFGFWKSTLFRKPEEIKKIHLEVSDDAAAFVLLAFLADIKKAEKITFEPRYSYQSIPDWLEDMAAMEGWEIVEKKKTD